MPSVSHPLTPATPSPTSTSPASAAGSRLDLFVPDLDLLPTEAGAHAVPAGLPSLPAMLALAALTGAAPLQRQQGSNGSGSSRASKRLNGAQQLRPVGGGAAPSAYAVLQKKAKVVCSQNADLEEEKRALLRQQEALKARIVSLRAILSQLGVDPDRLVPDCA